MQTDVRPKIKAALVVAVASLKDAVPISPTTPPVSGSGYKGTTKKEAVALPKFASAEKSGGGSPFLEFPVWLQNWNQHIGDYEEKSRSNMLLSHLDKDALKHIAGSENDYNA